MAYNSPRVWLPSTAIDVFHCFLQPWVTDSIVIPFFCAEDDPTSMLRDEKLLLLRLLRQRLSSLVSAYKCRGRSTEDGTLDTDVKVAQKRNCHNPNVIIHIKQSYPCFPYYSGRDCGSV